MNERQRFAAACYMYLGILTALSRGTTPDQISTYLNRIMRGQISVKVFDHEKATELRKLAGLNQRQLGEAVGLGQSQISAALRGRSQPSQEIVSKIEAFLGAESGDLYKQLPRVSQKVSAATKAAPAPQTTESAPVEPDIILGDAGDLGVLDVLDAVDGEPVNQVAPPWPTFVQMGTLLDGTLLLRANDGSGAYAAQPVRW